MSSFSSLTATVRHDVAHLLDGNSQWCASISASCVRRLILVLSFILLGAIGASAMPLAEYKARIHKAVAELNGVVEVKKYETAQGHADRVLKSFNTVFQLVPIDQPVEWEGATVQVNNAWLEDEFNNYRQVPRSDPRSSIILARIIERLSALEDRLTELDSRNDAVASTASKEQEKARLEEISRRDEFVGKPPQKNIFERTWERFKNWWNNLFPGSSFAPGQMSWLAFIAMIFVFALVAAVLGYVIWKLIPFFERRRAKLKLEKRDARIVLGERIAPDQTAADLLTEAEALARQGELRAAIRKAYIALLCELGDRKVLTLAQHKTNRDYLRAVRGKRPLLDEMQKLTNSFENHWYGFRQTTADDWAAFRSGYEKVLSFQF